MKDRHILFIANTSWYLWNFRRSSIEKALSLTYKVIVICAEKDKYADSLQKLGCDVLFSSMTRAGTNPLREFLTLVRLYLLIRDASPEAILSFTPKCNIYVGIISKLIPFRFIPNISGLGVVFGRQGILKRIVVLLYRFSLSGAHHIFFQNVDDQALFKKNNVGVGVPSSLIPGSGVALDVFKTSEIRSTGIVKFLFVGRLLKEKGINEFLAAAAYLKKQFPKAVQFDVYGMIESRRGPTLDELKALNDSGVINFNGVTDSIEAELPKYHCLILPSYYGEGVPRSLIEAAACGLALITTTMPGCKEVIQEGVNGFIVQPKSQSSLVEAILTFYRLPDEQKALMYQASRKLAETRFDEKLVLDRYFSVINNAD